MNEYERWQRMGMNERDSYLSALAQRITPKGTKMTEREEYMEMLKMKTSEPGPVIKGREELERRIAVMQASLNGKTIEYSRYDAYKNETHWERCFNPSWDWFSANYRVYEPPLKKKTETVTMMAYLDTSGRLVWYRSDVFPFPLAKCLRVPSEDKEVEVETNDKSSS